MGCTAFLCLFLNVLTFTFHIVVIFTLYSPLKRLLGSVTTWVTVPTLTCGNVLSGEQTKVRLMNGKSRSWVNFDCRHQNPTSVWEHEETSYKMLLLAIEENPEIKMTKEQLHFVRELICGGDKDKEKNGEYPYSARGPEKFYLYEIIANKVMKSNDKKDTVFVAISIFHCKKMVCSSHKKKSSHWTQI